MATTAKTTTKTPTPPAYDAKTGNRTDYGASIGVANMSGGKPVGGSSGGATTTSNAKREQDLANTAMEAAGGTSINTAQPSPATTKINPPNTTPNTPVVPQGQVPYEQALKGIQNSGQGSTDIANATNILKQKYQTGFNQTNAGGTPPPPTQGAANTTIQGNVPPPPIDTSNIDTALANDKGYQQLLTDQKDFNDTVTQKTTLVDTYNKLIKDAGIPAINTELLNTQKIIDGTEDDIRKEVQAVSGFATDSQILALSSARNKSLIQNYNNLLDTKKMAMENIQTMVGLAKEDQATAISNSIAKMGIDEKLMTYRDKFVSNATEAYNKVITAVGYDGLYKSLQADPTSIPLVEKTLGLATGQLKTLATTPKPKDLQFISGTDNQASGYFDKSTGTFTKLGGGKGSEKISLDGLTPEQQADPFVKLLANTKGGKPITDTFAQSLNKGLNVLGQIGGLQENIKDTNTGPLTGLFRGANPWDTNAQTIKAQLNAIVPNLARGVYGEVGVLTDNDIKTYSQTLPNLKSPEDIRNAVLGITVDLIGKSIKRTLEINAANQKDVSGFIDIYTEMNKTRDSIFSQLPGYTDKSTQFTIPLPDGKKLNLANFEK